MSYYRRDTLSIKSNKILANLFAELILLSQKVETFRQVIASVPYYDCVELFRVLDRDQKGYLSLTDFEYLIGDSHKKVVAYVFAWFDQAKLGEVSRLEFISFLMPRRNQELRQIIAIRIENPVIDQNLSETINQQLCIFTEMVNQIISHQLRVIEQRNVLLKQDDYSLKGVLNSLDISANSFIAIKDLLKFLRNYAIEATNEQLQDLLKIHDSKLQGKVNPKQFKWIIQGLQYSDAEYKQVLRKSIKKKQKQSHSKKKKIYFSESERQQKEKIFTRTPFRQKQQNYEVKSIYGPNQNNQKAHTLIKKAHTLINKAHTLIKNQRLPSQIHSAKRPTNFLHGQQKNNSSNSTNQNIEFYTILSKCKQAQVEAAKRDAELIIAEQEIKNKLKKQYYEKSERKKRSITEQNSANSYNNNRKKLDFDIMPNHLKDGDLKQRLRFETGPNICIRLPPETSNGYLSRDFIPRSFTQKRIPTQISYRCPQTSEYDRKINTIVQNFYRRNKEANPLQDSVKRSGNVANQIHLRSEKDLLGDNLGKMEHDQKNSIKKKNLDEQLQKLTKQNLVSHKTSNFFQDQIRKKLGTDLHPLNFSASPYDPIMHLTRQKPIQQNIYMLKQKAFGKFVNKSNPSKSNTAFIKSISTAQKQAERTDSLNQKTQERKKYGVQRYPNESMTNSIPRIFNTPLSAQQTLFYNNTNQEKDQSGKTAQTKYPSNKIRWS